MLGFLFGKKKVQRLTFNRNPDSEYAFQNNHFQVFMDLQHVMLTMGDSQIEFHDEGQKWRYLSFVMGAADRMSRMIEDDMKAHIWFSAIGLPQGYELFKNKTKAIDAMEAYGDPNNPQRFNAGKTGWEAMGIYMEKFGKESEEDKLALEHSSLLLAQVVRGY